MHEKRNFFMVILLLASIIWATWAWFFMPGDQHTTGAIVHKSMSVLLIVSLSAWLFYTLRFEDKLPDHMKNVVGPVYYEVDGLCLLPMIRVHNKHAELCVYYQNRFENSADCIVHLRPPAQNSFVIQPGFRDVHVVFKCDGGDFGVVRQPLAVPRNIQGEVLEVLMAASSWYPRSHGERWRSNVGMTCGSLPVDWAGNPLKIGIHEASSDIPLTNPVRLHLAMPTGVSADIPKAGVWRQEQIAAGRDLIKT
jgi:hypothetical protein